MKFKALAASLLAACMALGVNSCSDKDNASKAAADGSDTTAAAAVVTAPTTEAFAPTTNIRYYNLDSVMNNSEMVKTFNEANLRTLNELQAAQRSREAELQRLAANIQQKVQNNGYLSEASYNADMNDLNQKQQQAQNYLGSLQEKAQAESQRQQEQFLNALNAFLSRYNSDKHYDAILVYAPGEIFNPSLDITRDVIAGVNAAYTKPADQAPAK